MPGWVCTCASLCRFEAYDEDFIDDEELIGYKQAERRTKYNGFWINQVRLAAQRTRPGCTSAAFPGSAWWASAGELAQRH